MGARHTARAVIQVDYRDSDPFILMMDDVLDKKTVRTQVDLTRMPGLKQYPC